MGYFFNVIFLMGLTAIIIVGKDPTFFEGGNLAGKIIGGNNMVAMHLANAVGGNLLLGFLAAVAFATILAVVAGLTLAGASAYSHDIYVNVIKGGHATEEEQVRSAKLATIIFGFVAVALGIAFKGQNVAFMVGLAFAIAASANFPALLLSIVWKRFTTQGAVWSILVGALSSCGMIVLSKTVWVDIFRFERALFPMKNPAIFSMTLAFAVGILVSLLTPEREAQEKFEDEKVRTYLGVGAE